MKHIPTLPLSKPRLRGLLTGSAVTASVLIAVAGYAQTATPCDVDNGDTCSVNNSVVRQSAGRNIELGEIHTTKHFDTVGFAISIDNEPFIGAPPPVNPRRNQDLNIARADMQLRYDGLQHQRLLNVATTDLRAGFQAGDVVRFRTSTNYPAYIERAEIQIRDTAQRGTPIIATLPAGTNDSVSWSMPADGSGDFAYTLRVYDAQGRFDETAPLPVTRASTAFPTHKTNAPVIAAGEGKDRTRLRNIPLRGGRVIANGEGFQPGSMVRVMGDNVPVDGSGKFVVSRILPAGDHVVDLSFGNQVIHRDVEIPTSEWFYVGLADLTFGHKIRDDAAEADPDFKQNYSEGRLAYYVDGRTESGWRVTSSLDTGEGDLKDMFRRLNDKDPRHVIQRLDPEDLYPTYGDDSSAYDNTPTSGRFYVRAENDRLRFTWGDFRNNLNEDSLLAQSRDLYGAELRYTAPSVTENGAPRSQITVYAASPDTLPQRDILRGSGGSVYFLSHQDINGASESLQVQIIDPDTGRVVKTTRLIAGQDYEIDYIQGVVVLSKPLQSSASDGGLVQGAGGDYDVNLVALYEYTPGGAKLDGSSFGGRAETWINDSLRVGVSASNDETGAADQKTAGADLRYEFGQSFVEAEIVRTEGPGFARTVSTDGGLTLDELPAGTGAPANALRFNAQLDFADLGLKRPGQTNLWYERKDAGFSTLNEEISKNQELIGFEVETDLSDSLSFGAEFEQFTKEGGDRLTEAELRLSWDIDEHWTLSTGINHEDRRTIGNATRTGHLTQLGARLSYEASEDLTYYGFGQAAVSRSGGLARDNRIGVGVDAQLSEKIGLLAEVSGGDQGAGGKLRLRYAPTADNEIYLGYTLDPTRTGAGYTLAGKDRGTVVLGGKYRVSEQVSTYMENNWDLFGERRSLTRAYGVNYTPDSTWTLSAAVEAGDVRDSINGNFERRAYSAGVAYAGHDDQNARLRLEYRTDDGEGIKQDRETWALSAGYENRVSDDWRLLANLDALFSDSADGDFRDGEFAEFSLGYAYRPAENDRLNMLMRYAFVHDLPGVDQVNVSGSTSGPKQRSHILSLDANYDLNDQFTLGGKYGYRSSEITDRATDVTSSSTAHLGIARLEWHVVHKWDVMAEGRILHTEGDTRETGALLAGYRHVGNNAKIGIGYEWGNVSDDLTDIEYNNRGVFLNLIAKF
ncbi:hypothetical protein [Halocynthiibacter namhaensis]|uniref:hypothetical protein n=1 Tax=Halocynthiibacter namhaensis TaxID=1290553 RepID=UPI000691FEBB|nr:hypothetical protein [Halocynthiibacter namhaensis]